MASRCRHSGSLVLALGLLPFAGLPAGAQGLPARIDPGAIGQQTEEILEGVTARPQVPGSQTPGVVSPEPPPPLVLPPGGPTFLLTEVEFSPSELLSQRDLDAIRARHVGREVDLAGLQTIVNEVNTLYADRGYVTAAAMLPEQDLKDGRLRVLLIEGRVGTVTLTGRRTLNRRLVAGAAGLEGGEVVDAPALTRRVDRFNRTSSAQMQAALQAGSTFGLTDINLSVAEPRRNTLQLFADNLGVESVGEYEGGAYFQHYGLLGLDDRLSVYGLLAEGNLYGSASYNLAVTPWGTRAGVSYSRSGIRIVDGPFVPLDVKGTSQVFSANLAQPIVNHGPFLLLGNLAGSVGLSTTKQSGVTITDDRIRKVTAGFSASYYGSRFNATVSPTVSFTDASLDVTGQRFRYSVYQLSASASLLLGDSYMLAARGAGQVTDLSLLPGSDLFQIGGPATVRGYPSSAVAGDSGYYVNIELYRSFADVLEGLEGYVFLDHGSVYSDFPSRQSLTSVGVGVNYSWSNRLRGELSVGIPVSGTVPDRPDAAVYARIVATVF